MNLKIDKKIKMEMIPGQLSSICLHCIITGDDLSISILCAAHSWPSTTQHNDNKSERERKKERKKKPVKR